MSRTIINNGDTGATVRAALNGMSSELYAEATTLTGKIALSSAGMGAALVMATFGCSHMTDVGFTQAHTMAMAAYGHDPYIYYDQRPVFVGSGDGATTLVAAGSRGRRYAVGQSTPDHMVNWQLPQFQADVAAGFHADIGVSDGSRYNATGDFPTTIARLQTLIDYFLSPTGNNGQYFIVYGTFGIPPLYVRSWATYWQTKADMSGGRIIFVDTAAAVIDAKLSTSSNFATTGPSWVNRGGADGVVGGTFRDGAHLSYYGSYLVAARLAEAYRRICPRAFPRIPSWACNDYDSTIAEWSWGDLLGPNAGMVGNQGYNGATGSFDGTVVGTGHGGQPTRNRWNLNSVDLTAFPVGSITTSPNGGYQQTITMPTATASSFNAAINFDCTPMVAAPNGGDASRRFVAGVDIEVSSTAGLCIPKIRIAGVDVTPASGSGSDMIPNGSSVIFRMRTPFPIALTAADPNFLVNIPFRSGQAVGGTVINIRDAFFRRVL